MAREKFTCEAVIEALRKTKGMIYLAAELLDCSHSTVYNYIERHPSVKEARDAERGRFLDETELRLYNAVRRDEPWAISFSLKTIGRSRGYTERTEHEITGAGGGAIQIIGIDPDAD